MLRPTCGAAGAFACLCLLAGPTPAQGISDEAMAHFRKALNYQKAGQNRAAIEAYEAGIAVEPLPRTRSGAQIRYNLAVLYKDSGQLARGEKLLLESLVIREAVLPASDLNIAWSCYMLGLLHRDDWRFAQSEKYFKRSLAIRKEAPGQPGVAQSLLGLATLYDSMTDYRRAEPVIAEALERAVRQYGPKHGFVGEVLLAQAGILRGLGQRDKAIATARKALETYEATWGKDNLETSLAVNNLGVLCLEAGRLDEALALHRRASDIRSALPQTHPLRGQSLNNLGEVYRNKDEHAQALTCFRAALKIYEARLGARHPLTSQVVNNLAVTLLALGRWDEAEKHFLRSLDSIDGRLPDDHADFVTRLHNLTLIYFAGGRVEEAVKAADRQRRLVRRQVARLLPVLSEKEQMAYLRDQDGRRLRIALSGAVRSKDDAAREHAAAWLLNAKGVVQQCLAESAQLARDSKHPELGKLSAELVGVRKRLARLCLVAPPAGREKQQRQEAAELAAREQDLAQRLRKLGSRAVGTAWTELSAARQALPRSGVLIDVVRLPIFDPKAASTSAAWAAVNYVAWVTPREGKVQVVDLGPAEAIDGAIKEVRGELGCASKGIGKDEEAAEKRLREPLGRLSKLLLKPLLPRAGKAEDWVVCPDGNLWLVPWEALLLGDGTYAVEKHRIAYVTSGRDLAARPHTTAKPTAPLVLADPDFDLGAAEVADAPGDATRALPRDWLGKVRRLPGTAAEAKAVAPGLEKLAGQAPQVLTGKDAVKGAVLAAHSPRALVLCTHGFFLPEPPAGSSQEAANPLLRCGLLLAGCNKASAAGSSLTGVLTGLEVVGLDLRGTDLVVLSACETGLGDVQNGEGVAGLRQAFQLAGSQTVVSTLWQVPDKASARLMALFFENLSRGQSKAEALRAAKLKVIEERRDDFAAAHPFFWAAFTLTGQP
jgi:CHAT domain-containing protein/tetratricopeptide (TPR) repeat protein